MRFASVFGASISTYEGHIPEEYHSVSVLIIDSMPMKGDVHYAVYRVPGK